MPPSMIQYLGFEQNVTTRICLFRVSRVVDAKHQERWFRLSTNMPLISDNKFKLQDLPDLCFSKLKLELSCETTEEGLPLQMSISDGELRRYNEDHYPKRGSRSRASRESDT